LHLALSQLAAARFRYLDSYLRHFNNGLLSFSSSIHTSTEHIQTFSGPSVINLDAKSTLLLKSEHHKAVWSICLNILTDRPISGFFYTSPFCETSSFNSFVLRLTRFPLKAHHYPDYHHVYSYVTVSKNIFVPRSNSGHTPKYNTVGIGNCLQQPGQLSNQLHKSMRVNLNQLIKFSVP
jgi:hypothetical protein